MAEDILTGSFDVYSQIWTITKTDENTYPLEVLVDGFTDTGTLRKVSENRLQLDSKDIYFMYDPAEQKYFYEQKGSSTEVKKL